MVRSPARSLRLQFSERYTGQSTVVLPIAGQGSNRPWGPARRRRRSRPLPGAPGWPERSTSAPPRPAHGRHPPTAPCSPQARRQPTAVGPQRAADPQRVVAYWVRTRASAHPHVVHPGWRVNLPTAVQLVLAATAHRRTPEHAARCPPQRPDCSPRGIRGRPHAVTSAVTIDILLRPTATEPDRHETARRSPCPAPTATPGPHCPTPTCQAPTSPGCRRHRDDRDHRRPTRPCRRR